MARRSIRSAPAAAPGSSGEGAVPASTRERILDIALDLFIRKGYAETSLREIAAEIGVSKAALYYHFESKQDILLALHLRVHAFTGEVLPLLQAGQDAGDTWERLVDRLIGLALKNRRLLELHLRNQEAIAEMHRGPGLAKHGPVQQHDAESLILNLISDPALPVDRRVRRMASLGAIAGVLLATSALAAVSDVELEHILRGVVRDVLDGGR